MARTLYQNDVERIMRNVVVSPDGCWQWQGKLTSKGYGRVNVHGRTRRVHQLSHETFIGPIPEGLEVDHLCRVRHCVNPAHLEAVEHAENLHRSPLTIPARNVRKTHCPANHPYDDANTYISPRGQRICRPCRNEGVARSLRRQALRAANVSERAA